MMDKEAMLDFQDLKTKAVKKLSLKARQGGQGTLYASMGCVKMHNSKIGRKVRIGMKKRPVHSGLA